MGRNSSSRLAGIVCAAGLLLLGPGRLCQGGDLLAFQLDPNGPAVAGINGRLTYNAATGEFSASVVPLTFSSLDLPGGGFLRFTGGTETIDLFVNPDGSFRTDGTGMQLDGTLSIGGTTISGTLLQGGITAFGAESPGPPVRMFNGLFDITGGLLTAPIPLLGGGTLPSQFPLGGAAGGFILFAETATQGTLGDFTRDFDSSKLKKIDGLALVPEPASWVLSLIAGLVLSTVGLVRYRTLRAFLSGGVPRLDRFSA
jgi:hypothetical protein